MHRLSAYMKTQIKSCRNIIRVLIASLMVTFLLDSACGQETTQGPKQQLLYK